MSKNRNFGQKSKCCPKIEILPKNRNFGQQSKFWPTIKIFAKNRNFRQQSKFSPKIEIFAKNRNFRQKSKFCPRHIFYTPMPERVERIFFCDPWGWQAFDPQKPAYTYAEKPFIQRILITIMLFIGTLFTPFVILRLFGSFGVKFMKIARPEMVDLLGNNVLDFLAAENMVKPTGEYGFMKLHLRDGYAKHPMSEVK